MIERTEKLNAAWTKAHTINKEQLKKLIAEKLERAYNAQLALEKITTQEILIKYR